jgi:hypothetical protein
MRECPAKERCLALESCIRRRSAGAQAASNPKLIQVEFTVNFLVSMKFLFIQIE